MLLLCYYTGEDIKSVNQPICYFIRLGHKPNDLVKKLHRQPLFRFEDRDSRL
jgi:hypothetical protein